MTNEQMNKSIIVVSGLPRSGTSLMMQILAAAGIPILTDQKRRADQNNPKDYYEYEKVKQLKTDQTWLKNARGKAVKIISALLKYLSPDHHYQVIFINRKLPEVLASQRKMLAGMGKTTDPDEDKKLIPLFQKHLQEIKSWLKRQPNIDLIEINYNSLVQDPFPQLKKLVQFLGLNVDLQKLAAVIDPNLYCHRSP